MTLPLTDSLVEVNIRTAPHSSIQNKFELLNKVNVVMPVIKLVEVKSEIKLDITINSTILDYLVFIVKNYINNRVNGMIQKMMNMYFDYAMSLCNKVLQAQHNYKSHYMLATFYNIETINNRGMLVEFEGHIENDKSKFLIPEQE